MNNLPPGCSVSDLPGNRPEDRRFDRLVRRFESKGLGYDEACERTGEIIRLKSELESSKSNLRFMSNRPAEEFSDGEEGKERYLDRVRKSIEEKRRKIESLEVDE